MPDGAGAALALDANGNLKTAVTVGDLSIGAVEIKNSTTDDRVTVTTDGNLQQTSFNPYANVLSGNASNTDGTSTAVIAAQSGLKTYLTDVTITNTSAAMVYVEMKDGATTKWTFPVPAAGGVTFSFTSPIKGSTNTAWNFDPSAAASTIYCSAAGYTATT